MSGIGVVTNPRSRRNRKNPGLQAQLAYVLGERGALAAPTDLDALEKVIQHFRDREIDVLAINGGDGTNHVVLSALLRVYGDAPLPKIALLRGGTMNTVASGLGVRGSPDDLLGRLVDTYHTQAPFQLAQRSLLVVGDKAGFLFGNGAISKFLEVYYEDDDPSPWSATKLVVTGVLSALVNGALTRRVFAPVNARVSVNGSPWAPTRWLTVGVGSVDDIGLGFRPFFRALQHPGQLHALGFACEPMDLIRQLWNIFRARPIDNPNILEAVTEGVVIEADEPLGYMIDGDFHQGGQRLEVKVGPTLQMILL